MKKPACQAARAPKKPSRACLGKFLKSYKGLEDIHLPLFREVQRIAKPRSVLYPGSYWHLTASLVFCKVLYVDCDSKVGRFFEDPALLDWVKEHKDYASIPEIDYRQQTFESLSLAEKGFDLLISMSAGIISKPCGRFVKRGGYFLVSDAHFDARTTALDPRFELVAVYNPETKRLEKKGLESCFMTTAGEKISAAQVKASISKPKGSRGFKLKREDWFHLFKRVR
ncbi:unnamed protein product [Symbiodinium natans]|uniref:Methyltransferase type 11 domain-containing protein n=1 Tax=Symbiodinium natans TaxID=878477 RepID=A0A812MH98_9DINO|nr:unnamed protein product [Symbiodinium natans]